jgi:hypothetical protein
MEFQRICLKRHPLVKSIIMDYPPKRHTQVFFILDGRLVPEITDWYRTLGGPALSSEAPHLPPMVSALGLRQMKVTNLDCGLLGLLTWFIGVAVGIALTYVPFSFRLANLRRKTERIQTIVQPRPPGS